MALDNGATINERGFFHTHVVIALETGEFLGLLGHLHEHDGKRKNDPNNFNLFTDTMCNSRFIPTPSEALDPDPFLESIGEERREPTEGLGFRDLGAMLGKQLFTDKVAVNFRQVKDKSECGDHEQVLMVGDVKICWQLVGV